MLYASAYNITSLVSRVSELFLPLRDRQFYVVTGIHGGIIVSDLQLYRSYLDGKTSKVQSMYVDIACRPISNNYNG